jgi:hypothetical protein
VVNRRGCGILCQWTKSTSGDTGSLLLKLTIFPLMKGVMNATERDLKAAVSFCGRAALASGLVLLAGLIIEVRLAFLHLPYDSPWEIWGQVSANILVACGVGGELLFSHLGSTAQGELLRRTEDKLANATLELTRLQERLAPRRLSPAQFAAFQKLKGKLTTVSVAHEQDSETFEFAAKICAALEAAGIKTNLFPRSMLVRRSANSLYDPRFDPSTSPTDFDWEPLKSVLNEAEIPFEPALHVPHDVAQIANDFPMIVLGSKPWPEPSSAARAGSTQTE